MKIRAFYIYLLTISFLVLAGCASRSDQLAEEYDMISQQLDSLLNEQKAIVNLDTAAEKYLKAKQEYEQRKNELDRIRKDNESQGLTTGPEIPEGISIEDTIEVLKKNFDILSDSIRELEKKKGEIATEQSAIDREKPTP